MQNDNRALVEIERIGTIDIDGTNERITTAGPPPGQAWYANYGHPVFAMDGESLFVGRRGGIDQSNPDGSNLHPVFETDGSIAM
ncbi:MAG TPA: hypothetical protein VM925_05185, partial [Labilithrix sp.]|nr:hypothetical protein [Labilithrix sp.]